MEIRDKYRSIAAPSEGLYKDRGSRFIALAYPVESEEEVKALLSKVRNQFHDARHHCYAYRLGCPENTLFRSSDDGEPSGSAGRPILGQIDSVSLSDVLVIVVRYFGGIKLGVPGLIKAYKESTADALSQAVVVDKVATITYRLDFDYGAMNGVMKVLKDMDLPQWGQDFGLQCSLNVKVPLSAEQDFLDHLSPLARASRI